MISNWTLLWVAIGGFFGAVSRYQLSLYLTRQFTSPFPLGTIVVNLLGCLIIGRLIAHPVFYFHFSFLVTGFLGAFTTFSSIHLDMIRLLQKRLNLYACTYIFLTYGCGILFVYFGYLL